MMPVRNSDGSMSVSTLFFPYLNFTLIILLTIFITVKMFRQTVMKLLRFTQRRDARIPLRFQILMVSILFFTLLRLALRFHIFSCRYRVNATPKRKNFVPFSSSPGQRPRKHPESEGALAKKGT